MQLWKAGHMDAMLNHWWCSNTVGRVLDGGKWYAACDDWPFNSERTHNGSHYEPGVVDCLECVAERVRWPFSASIRWRAGKIR